MTELPPTPLPRREWIACCRPAGRRGYPPELVAAMHSDYTLLGSLRRAAAVWGISNQSFHDVMRRRGLQRRKKRNPFIEFQGERFALEAQGYYRSTRMVCRKRGNYRLLHRVVWEHHHGPIPHGHIVAFRDKNRANCAIENLICIPKSQSQTLRSEHSNGYTRYEETAGPLREAYYRAVRESSDPAEIESARLAYESIPRPTNGTPEVRHRVSQSMWDSLTPEQRAARIAKAVATRRRNAALKTEHFLQ